jgi:hypothetical protein
MAQSDTANLRSKAIHVVYDDSGSMIEDDNHIPLNRWGQAKYAMEVFAVMLEKKDSMNVYYMSDFYVTRGGKVDASPRITMTGYESAKDRVKKVHDTITYAYGTPYDAVAKAYADLKNINADDKWLVVLTDGEFNQYEGKIVKDGSVDVNKLFSQYVNESGVKIILLAMGDDAEAINPSGRIYFNQAKSSNEILEKITSICNQIFNRIKLSNEREFTFDIPVSEFLVFAQGAGVEVNSIKGGSTFNPNESVSVRYSERAALNYDQVRTSPELTGVVSTFQNNFQKGSYRLDITGKPVTVDVYYKPVVNVGIKLYQGRKEINANNITEGKYQIQFGIIDEDGKFFESSTLGKVIYEATVQNNGRKIINSGDTIDLSQGELSVYVLARFKDINTADSLPFIRNVLAPLSFMERVRNWIKQYWYIFWPLLYLLLGLLLYWLLWGRKKRFPKYMARTPIIQMEKEDNIIKQNGKFKIYRKTKWLPFCAQKGAIRVVAEDKPLPKLQVRASGKDTMELINSDAFTPEKLNGTELRIGGRQIREGTGKNMEISCGSTIKTIFPGRDGSPDTTYTCHLAKR